MARYRFSHDDCVKGGQARAAMADFPEACSKGFWATMESHPFFARKHLKAKIKAGNAATGRDPKRCYAKGGR